VTKAEATPPVKTGRVVKKKVKKDKNAPKKPMSPFFCYQHVRRSQIKLEDPDISNNDIIKTMAAEWRAMEKEQQAPFIAETELHKKRYEQEKQVYNEKLKVIKEQEALLAKKNADEEAAAAAKVAKKTKPTKKDAVPADKKAAGKAAPTKKDEKKEGAATLVGKKRPASKTPEKVAKTAEK